MAEVLTYRQISFDTTRPRRSDGLFKATAFDVPPYPYVDGSTHVTDLDEKPIIRWLMLNPQSRQLIFGELGLPQGAFYQPEVVQPFYAAGMGDIDLIVCDHPAPHRATAVECKRVKIETVNIDQDKINKLQDVVEGVQQANKLHDRFGFFQTYLAIITEVGASGQAENIPNRGVRSYSTPRKGDTKTPTFRQLVEFPGRAELHDEIGIVFIEVVQSSRISIDQQVTVRVCVYRRAQPRDQLDSVTNRVIELIN